VRGRPPKPTALKNAEGNLGHRAVNTAEPRPAAAVPSCPSHLGPQAKREWQRVGKLLARHGLLTEVDRAALAAYCTAYGRWVEAEEQVRTLGPVVKSPTGYPIQNPYLAIANKAMQQLTRLLGEFGMSPSSRARVAMTQPDDAGDPGAVLRFPGSK
jgi:P27 family predicted phage terminase small subunit